MTILNVLLLGDRALVAMDTRVRKPVTKESWNTSKMFPIVHSNILIACRGEIVLGELALDWYLNLTACDFDSIALRLPGDIVEIAKKYEDLTATTAAGNELVIVGWSESIGSMQGVRCVRPRAGSPFNIERMETGSMAPTPTEDLGHIQCKDHVEYLIEISRSQTRQAKRDFPYDPIGGRLILADIAKDRMGFRAIADLDAI